MSDPHGFQKYPRHDLSYRPVDSRLKDFAEITAPQPPPETQTESARCMDCGVAFCQSETGCPLGNLIPEWNELASEGRWAEAYEKLQRTNNFPEFTASLCPAPCESACVLGINHAPVAIKSIEKQIIETAFDRGLVRPRRASIVRPQRIAIIGSGPAGLTAAQELARRGYQVTVFEREPLPGGLLRYGIPDFKMAKEHVDRRIGQLRAEGVDFKTSVEIGVDITLAELRADYSAVALTIGAEIPRDLEVPGRDLHGIHWAMDYLTAQNRAISGEGPTKIDARGKRVIILGGGDTGSDCLGTALRQQATSVEQFEIQARPPERRSAQTPWPQWPMKLRFSHAHEEGGHREWSLSTKEFRGSNGKVEELIAERATGEQVSFPADLVILAMGFTGVMLGPLAVELARDDKGLIQTDTRYMTSENGLFTAGDARRGASLIVWAITEGRKMATGIHNWISLQTTEHL